MMKMKIRISLDRMSARVDSIQRRTQLLVSRLVPPAKARGANTAATDDEQFADHQGGPDDDHADQHDEGEEEGGGRVGEGGGHPGAEQGFAELVHVLAERHLEDSVGEGVDGVEERHGDRDGDGGAEKGDDQSGEGFGDAAAVLADHGGDELDQEQGEGHEDGDAGHEADVDPEGVGAGSGVEGHDGSP